MRPTRALRLAPVVLASLATWAGGAHAAAFLERARVVFGERFADPVNDFREVLFATGTKP